MNKKRKILSLCLCFLLLFAFNQSVEVKAETSKDYKIISDCPVTVEQAEKWAKSKGATQAFIDLADLYWKYYKDCGVVNPGIAYAQAAKETGYGHFGGVLDESFCNPCGLKNEQGGDDNDPDAHERFDSWKEGVQAHLDHLALYAGAKGYPKNKTYDPRHFKIIMGRCTTVNELGGANKWAPSDTYGEEVNELYRSMLISAGIEKDDSSDNNITKNNENSGKLNFTSVKTEIDNNINISSSVGWKKEEGNWYYYKSDNNKAVGWINPDGNWYYLNGNGVMAVDWIQQGQTWYYFDKSGVMVRGWKNINNVWYYFQGDGSMATGLKQINGKNYYLNDNGAMVTGWIKIRDNSYYFNGDGTMALGWIKIGNDEYYLDKTTGAMVRDTTIDGFKLDQNGKKQIESSSDNSANKLPQSDKNTNSDKKIIVVDPGHAHGSDEGVKITTGGVDYSETDLDMEVAEKLETELQKRGYSVIMTRTENQKFTSVNESLAHRADVANDSNAAFYISIHHNTVGGVPEARGVETYYSVAVRDENYGGGLDSARLEKSKQMAKLINDNIVKKLNANNRGAKSDKQTADGSLFVLRNTNMPAVLVETGFLSNEEEAQRCADSESQQLVAEAIAEVISQNI